MIETTDGPGCSQMRAMRSAFRVGGVLGFVVWLLGGWPASRADAASDLKVSDLRCEYRKDPLSVESARPRLSWVLSANARGQRQTAYQILVASDPASLKQNQGDLWDSGKVLSDSSALLPNAGKPLASRQQCFWKVRVWDKDGRTTEWSKPARWTMGLLHPDDWSAKWIRF